MREMRVAQARGEIERADHLRHADPRLAGRARVAVGHVGRGFFAVGVDALDLRPALHLGEGPAQHRGDHEHVRDAVAGEHVSEALGAGDLGHGVFAFSLEEIPVHDTGRPGLRGATG
jgi:hypothetical protein